MKAHARNTDPQTSHDAAESVKNLSETQSRILNLFELPNNGYTDEELISSYFKHYGYWFPASDASIRSRRAELVKRGELRDSGQKRLTKLGRGTTVWTTWRLL